MHQILFMKTVLALFLVSTFVLVCCDSHVRRDTTVNAYIDKVIVNAQSLMKEHNLDPYHLKNIDLQFPIKLILPMQCRVQANNVLLHGLSTIYREGDAVAKISKETLDISVGVGVHNLTFDGHTKVTAGIFNFTFELVMVADLVMAKASLQIPLQTGAKPRVTHFDIQYIGNIKATTKNWGLLNFLAEAVLEKVVNEFKDALREQLRQPVVEALEEILQKIPMM